MGRVKVVVGLTGDHGTTSMIRRLGLRGDRG